ELRAINAAHRALTSAEGKRNWMWFGRIDCRRKRSSPQDDRGAQADAPVLNGNDGPGSAATCNKATEPKCDAISFRNSGQSRWTLLRPHVQRGGGVPHDIHLGGLRQVRAHVVDDQLAALGDIDDAASGHRSDAGNVASGLAYSNVAGRHIDNGEAPGGAGASSYQHFTRRRLRDHAVEAITN